jgi:AcrR family transcriptional regulator
MELCQERGFRQVGVDDLCARAGIDPAAFDARYTDLEDCFCQVYERCAAEFLARLESAAEGESDWRARLRAIARACLLHIQEDPARAHFTVVEALSAGERVQLARERVFERLASYVDEGRAEAGARRSLTPNTAESLNGAVFQHMRAAIENERDADPEDLLAELMYAAVLPYLGPEAAAEELEIRTSMSAQARGEGP